MLKKLQQLKETLQEFVDQRDHLTIVINGTDDDMVYVIKTLQGVEQETPSDIFVMFPQPAPSGADYAAAVIQSIQTQLEALNALRREDDLPTWPPLPAICVDPDAEPGKRIRAALQYMRDQLPPEEDHRVVVGLLPMQIANEIDYARIVSHLVPRDGFEPWMRSLRILVRDRSKSPFVVPALQNNDVRGVLIYDIDFSTAAMTDALADEAQDSDLPPPRRMAALMQLAALDFAHKRYDQAMEKYAALHDYHLEAGQPEMQALSLLGAGDVLQMQGDLDTAKQRYQQGLALAVPAGSLPVALNLLIGAGQTSMQLEQWDEAEGYWEWASKVAGKLLNPIGKCDAMEQLGLAQLFGGKPAEALVSWDNGAKLSKQMEYPHREVSILERLVALHKQTGRSADQQLCQQRLTQAQDRLAQAGG